MRTAHSFHIPVMGTGFTMDSPLKVARYGISSVVSLVDDRLIEEMRKYYCGIYHEAYEPIKDGEHDARARRITSYLNLLDKMVKRQIEELKNAPFESGSEITKYFELLDDQSPLKQEYLRMLNVRDKEEKVACRNRLRDKVAAGFIDVNIMTKLDRAIHKNGSTLSGEYSDARAALRGFAQSTLDASVVLSAGLNLHLYTYMENFEDFYPDAAGHIKKRIILKVSDFRSAQTQGKVLAKRGLWVSEYRIESGLNCGGHAFATDGFLAGPILEKFKQDKQALVESLFGIYQGVLTAKRHLNISAPLQSRVTYQGGIGTAAENKFLLRYYQLDATGWGSPFLLVPEASSVDEETMTKLEKAGKDDVYLSDVSPLGVPYQNLRNTASELEKQRRIEAGTPGSPCPNKALALNTEFPGPPLCTASYEYQTKKIEQLKQRGLSQADYASEFTQIVEKSCVCHDLGDSTLMKYHITPKGGKLVPAVCPGPNIAFFSRKYSLKEMIDHIYGRKNVIEDLQARPSLFINELRLYVDYLKKIVQKSFPAATSKEVEYFAEFKANLLEGIEYYKKLLNQFLEESDQSKKKFLQDLMSLRQELEEFVLSHRSAFAIGQPVTI